jgi:hypothetical protein
MKTFTRRLLLRIFVLVLGCAGTLVAQCPPVVVTAGLRAPTKITLSPIGNLLVAEAGAGNNQGRISIVDPETGATRTLLDGLPSAINLIGESPSPSGPSGLAVRGRTLYMTIGSGNSTVPGPLPGSELPNPSPASPLFSSVWRIHFSAHAEMTTSGFILSAADQQALKAGQTLAFDSGGGDKLTVRVLTDFPDYVAAPLPGLPNNVVSSNPFGLLPSRNRLDVVDASLNLLAVVNVSSGATAILTRFAKVPNTLPFGPPLVDAVPSSIRLFGQALLVPYLTGFPFGPGAAQINIVDPLTRTNQPFILGLTAAIDILPIKTRNANNLLVLEFGGAGLAQPGSLLKFLSPGAAPQIVADCLITPTSMARDEKTGSIYVTEIFTGRVVRITAPDPR